MATEKQKNAAKQNIKKAQEKWENMSKRQHSLAQPEGRSRAKPGTKGEGEYFRIVIRDKDQFQTFRYHDVGRQGHIQRLSGKRSSGSWDTQAWLVSKNDAHADDGMLTPDTKDVEDLFNRLGSKPEHVKGDIFEAKPRPNVPESEKPTKEQKQAQQENIKKAQEARWR